MKKENLYEVMTDLDLIREFFQKENEGCSPYCLTQAIRFIGESICNHYTRKCKECPYYEHQEDICYVKILYKE